MCCVVLFFCMVWTCEKHKGGKCQWRTNQSLWIVTADFYQSYLSLPCLSEKAVCFDSACSYCQSVALCNPHSGFWLATGAGKGKGTDRKQSLISTAQKQLMIDIWGQPLGELQEVGHWSATGSGKVKKKKRGMAVVCHLWWHYELDRNWNQQTDSVDSTYPLVILHCHLLDCHCGLCYLLPMRALRLI